MKKLVNRRFFSIFCAMLLIFTTAFNVVAEASEVKEKNTKEKSMINEEADKTKATKEKVEDGKVIVNVEIYVQKEDDKDELHKKYTVKGVENEKLTIFTKDITKDKVISVKGGDFKLTENKKEIVGTYKNDTILKITVNVPVEIKVEETKEEPKDKVENKDNKSNEVDKVKSEEPKITEPSEVKSTEPKVTEPTEVKPTEPKVTEPTEVKPTEPEVKEPTEAKPTEPEVKTTKPEKESTVYFEVYAYEKDGNHKLLTKFTNTKGIKVKCIVPFTEKIVSVEGGDFKIDDNKVVGSFVDGTVVKVVIQTTEKYMGTMVTYGDENGLNVIGAPEIILYEEPGTITKFTPPEIKGYKYVGPKELRIPDYEDFGYLALQYERIPLKLTVNYVDENGKVIKKKDILEGKIRDEIKVNIPKINGYKIAKVDFKNGKIAEKIDKTVLPYTFGAENAELTLIYNKDATKPATTTPQKPTTKTSKVVKTPKTVKKVLPKTGIAKTYLPIAGITLLVAGVYIFKNKKKI